MACFFFVCIVGQICIASYSADLNCQEHNNITKLNGIKKSINKRRKMKWRVWLKKAPKRKSNAGDRPDSAILSQRALEAATDVVASQLMQREGIRCAYCSAILRLVSRCRLGERLAPGLPGRGNVRYLFVVMTSTPSERFQRPETS